MSLMVESRQTRTKQKKAEINSSIVVGIAVMFGEVVSAQQRSVESEAIFRFRIDNFCEASALN